MDDKKSDLWRQINGNIKREEKRTNIMRKIKYFDEEFTFEEFVRKKICENGGTQSVAFKDDLIGICKILKIPYNDKMSKNEVFELLVANGYDYRDFAEKFGVGVSSQVYQREFNIMHKDVKRMEKKGILKVVGKYRFRAYGKYMYAPLYDVYQFCEITNEEMKNLLKE